MLDERTGLQTPDLQRAHSAHLRVYQRRHAPEPFQKYVKALSKFPNTHMAVTRTKRREQLYLRSGSTHIRIRSGDTGSHPLVLFEVG